MTSRTISYEFTTKETISSTFQTVKQNLTASGQAAEQFSQRLSASTSESDKLRVSVRETGNEFTRMRDQANAASAQNKAAFESQRNDLRLLAEQARTTAAQTRAAQVAARSQQSSGGSLGLGDIAAGSFIGNLATQGVQQLQQLAGGMLQLGENSLQLAGKLEMSRAAFTSLLGSAQAADQEIAALRAFSDKAPLFDTTNTQHFAQMLAGAGEQAQKLVPDLKAIGAVVTGTGGGTEQLQATVLAYTQVLTQQKLAGQEALQFANANIPVWRIIAESLGVTTAQAKELSQEGKITADVFQQAFNSYAIAHFNDSLSQAGDTIQGLGAQIQSGWQNALTEFGTGLAEGVKPTLRDIAATLQDPRTLEAIRAWGVEAGAFAKQLWDGAKAVASWVGLDLPALPAAPDYSALKVSTDGVQSNLKATITYQTDFTRQITTAKTEVDRLRDAQSASSAASQAASNAIRDAQTQTDREFDRRLNILKDEGTQLERNYQVAKQQRDLEQARAQLSDDTRLAGDIFSSAGQVARERLKADQARVTDQQEQIAQDTAKFENRQAQTSVERSKQASDQRAQDQITGIQRAQQASEQATQARIRDLEATAQNYQKLQDALAKPDAAIQAATTEYSTFYTATIPQAAQQGTATVISTMTRQYSEFYTATLPQAAAQARPLIFTALFGSGDEQKKAGGELATNVIDGLTTAFMNSHDHNLKIIGDLLKGDLKAAWDDANADSAPVQLPAWLGGGQLAGTGPRSAAMPTTPPPGRDPHGHYLPGGPPWVWHEDTPSPGVAAPNLSPADAAALTGAVPFRVYNGPYSGGRAAGGPVEAGGWYRVGESGPEWLHAGGAGRVAAPAPGGDTYIFNISGVIGNQTQVVDAINQALAQNIRQKGARF